MSTPDPEPPSDRSPTEADFVHAIASAFSSVGLAIDVTDDCGATPPNTQLVTTDAIIEGHHFDLRWDTLEQIGRQAAIVNLSDLAGSGAQPEWMVWSLAFDASWRETDISQLALGFGRVAAEYGVQVVAGNLSSIDGPMVISVTAAGSLYGPQPLLRSSAQRGDLVYVSGELGNGALGYLAPSVETRAIRHQWRPHLAESAILATTPGVHACMDISDGLLLDASRLSAASGICIEFERSRIPLGQSSHRHSQIGLEAALSGGEDYVLLFTASADTHLPSWAIEVGRCLEGAGIKLDGQYVDATGHDHILRRS